MSSFLLSSGARMPKVGFGTSRLAGARCEEIVLGAIRAGYRSVDTAKLYGNEAAVGRAVRRATAAGVCKRSDLFLTSKLCNDDHRCVEAACRRSLAALGVGYLDLYLVHWPIPWRKGTVFCADWTRDQCDTWRDMQRLVELGLVKSVGVSNFGAKLLARLIAECGAPYPAVNQLQLHPLSQEQALVRFCAEHDIICTAWSPLAKHSKMLFAAPALSAIAKAHGVSPTQVVLKWNVSRGVVVIPKSTNPAHYRDNLDLFRFELSEEEMALVRAIDRGARGRQPFDAVGCFEDTAFMPWGLLGQMLKVFAWCVWQVIPSCLDLRNPQRSATELLRPLHELSVMDGVRAALGLALVAWGGSRLFSL
jgi:diketogulonate reductase-like aldo/keto reductase